MRSIAIVLALFLAQHTISQPVTDEDAIRRNAINIARLDSFDERIANIFQSQKLILVGEIHGTAEPAEFVNYLVANLIGKGRKIYVGLEISPQDMPGADDLRDSAALSNSAFFTNESGGKASQAWLKLLTTLSRLNGVELFFFNMTTEQIKKAGLHHADSIMYVNIKSQILKDTSAVYICLSGNYHNILTGDRFPVPMGNYFFQDRTLGLSLFNMVSFNHQWVEGGAYCNEGDGTRLHTLQNSDYPYTITGMRNYFSFTHELLADDYNGVLFTYHVTASFGLR